MNGRDRENGGVEQEFTDLNEELPSARGGKRMDYFRREANGRGLEEAKLTEDPRGIARCGEDYGANESGKREKNWNGAGGCRAMGDWWVTGAWIIVGNGSSLWIRV
ncbi:unnamed protein product [Calypogeia fissa]